MQAEAQIGQPLTRPTWRRLALLAVFVLAAALRLWRLDQNGYDNEYYAAAVRSMTGGWRNFLFNSFDPAGFVSVDKPPVGLWMQVAGAKLFGFSGLGVILPQVLESLASVGLVYSLVARIFGAPAGLLAALFLAVTPVSVAVDRSSNIDSCLVLVLLLAACVLMRAAETGHRGLLLLSMALIGVGFNVKMLAAFVVLPTFALVYFLGAPLTWRRRLADLTLAGLVVAAVSLSWPLLYDLTPPERRPFVGSTRQDSMLELAVGHNGLGRFVRPARLTATAAAAPRSTQVTTESGASPGLRTGSASVFVRAPVGPLRLADRLLAAQVGWLFPLALMGILVTAAQGRLYQPLSLGHLAVLLWGGWALTYGIVYSFAGGIFHFYYLATMGPPLAALAGIGVVSLWGVYGKGGWRAALLPLTLLLTALWQAYLEWEVLGWRFPGALDEVAPLLAAAGREGDWRVALYLALIGGTLLAAAVLLATLPRGLGRGPLRAVTVGALAVGLGALLITPAAWALSSVLAKGIPVLPSANLARLLPRDAEAGALARGGGGAGSTRRLVGFLRANRQGERFLLATSSTRLAAPIIIETGEAVMAMGGFHGLDPILTPEKLSRLIETKQVRFVMLGDLSLVSRRLGGEAALKPMADWVRVNGKPVDPALWRQGVAEDGQPGPGGDGRTRRMQLYDLRPQAGVVSGPPS